MSFANFTQQMPGTLRANSAEILNLRLDRQTVEGHRDASRAGKHRGKQQRYQNGDRSWNLYNESPLAGIREWRVARGDATWGESKSVIASGHKKVVPITCFALDLRRRM